MRSPTSSKNAVLLTLAIGIATLTAVSQPAKASALIDQAIFSAGDLAISGGAYIYGDVHTNGNFDISGASTITGFTSAVGYVKNDGVNAPGAGPNPGFLLGGFSAGAASIAYPTMSAVLLALGAPVDHDITGNLLLSGSEPFSGIYHVTGNIDISSDYSGTATFLADGNITVSAFGGRITGAVLNANFPFGLALFSATGFVDVSGDDPIAGSVAAKTTANVSSSGPVQAPEPSSALLLGLGCLGAAMTRKRKNA